ncbi:ubiquinol-cytochrome-c reductase complex assembly factor 1-like [Watersipora subatra]|uniref:ubiquinol-cytochrome-c reductase complex assembly factor 1-like n=1 Tax=Watersipora subatra TaxID=2589382 RepID=UPI00355BEC4C
MSSTTRSICRRLSYLHRAKLSLLLPTITQKLAISTAQQKPGWMKDKFSGGRVESLIKQMGFHGLTVHDKESLENASVKLYVSCSEYSDFQLFRKRFDLEDTFSAWADILNLHMWMLATRFNNSDTEYFANDFEFLRARTTYHMWVDIDKRAKQIVRATKIRKKSIRALSDHFLGVVLLYDEGYQTDDKVLAGALWKCLLQAREDVEPKDLLSLVDYVHRNLHHLKSLSDDQFFSGYVSFLPLDSDKPDVEKGKRVQSILTALP